MAAIYGTDILDDARLAVKGLLDALKTAMDGAATDPRPLAIYNRHETIIPSAFLPAATVEVSGVDSEDIVDDQSAVASGGVYTLFYNLTCEIRIHTNFIYEGAYVDTVKISQLLNSIMNYVMTNGRSYFKSNITGYIATDYSTSEMTWPIEFEESQTIGGYYKYDITVHRDHTQS
jgi:hypothetical protein